VDPTAAVYSIVDAVCDTTGVKQVQIQIDGKTDVKYLDTVDISQPFEPSREMLSKTDRETEKLAPSVGVDQMLPK
jgi:germination protein M